MERSKLFCFTFIIIMPAIKETIQQCPGLIVDPDDYIGCGLDFSSRVFPHYYGSFDYSLDNNKCIAYCKNLKFAFAGSEASYQCFCGNYQNWTTAPNAECNYACSGNASQICGGHWRISVYRTGITRASGIYRHVGGRKLKATPVSTVKLENTLQDRNVECAMYCKQSECNVFSVFDDICEIYSKFEDLCSGYIIDTVARVYMLQ